MPAKRRLTMRQLRQTLRLAGNGTSSREIAVVLGIVNRASFYDPEINRSYGMMASHNDIGILPARPKRPKEKLKVENGVRFAQSCSLRKQTFFSLAEANAAIAQALDLINDHIMRRLGVTRRQLFENFECAALANLPGDDYEFADWRLVGVSTDYHVEYKTFLYSVPHALIRRQVVRLALP